VGYCHDLSARDGFFLNLAGRRTKILRILHSDFFLPQPRRDKDKNTPNTAQPFVQNLEAVSDFFNMTSLLLHPYSSQGLTGKRG